MSRMTEVARAYQAGAAHRSLRAQEAEVFQMTNAGLRAARAGGAVAQVRALADNRRLWTTVNDLMRDPSNALPVELRAAIFSVGLAVQREMDRAEPNFEFLISINENLAAGLAAG
jgi:flagellar biosynthesis activator protein FlaF